MTLPDCIEIEPAGPADACVIWLHGLGASGDDFVPLVPELKLPDSARIRHLFPHAPQRPVTINGGYIMPAWYDILEMSLDRKVDVAQLRASASNIQALITREIERGIDSRRIILIGFSQGGAVAYETALTCPEPLGGLIALSTYFATADSIEPDPASTKLPIAIHHGRFDDVVPESLAIQARSKLEAMGYQPGYASHDVDHGVYLEEVEAISGFIREQLSL